MTRARKYLSYADPGDPIVLFEKINQTRLAHEGEIILALGTAGVDAGGGIFRTSYDTATELIETIWSDEADTGEPPPASDFSALRTADVDGVEP